MPREACDFQSPWNSCWPGPQPHPLLWLGAGSKDTLPTESSLVVSRTVLSCGCPKVASMNSGHGEKEAPHGPRLSCPAATSEGAR